MDIFLIIGIVVGLFAVSTGLLLKGATVAILLNGEAVIVILVGTAAAVMNSFPKKDFLNIPKLFGVAFREKGKEDPIEIIKQMIEMAHETRKNGLLSLEGKIQDMSNVFMKQGLEMVVDGTEPEYIKQVLSDEIEAMEERHRGGASIFTTAGGASPTLGVLGAVIGLIGALGNLNDTAKLGESISAAFVATIYGIFFGYVIWHPLSSRLKRKSHEEVSNKQIILEGILAIQEGKNPKTIERKLLSMLSPKDRKKFETASSSN
ncbi:flagellar motor stator protein MotA [Clostridium thailandense]|uniref:Flagellar motor stator protein MotA n=1 Tax=Clostridium thailandense TaxID=2794346 RepID=A0A949X3R6_9CLOT|nr:flagellar motor stator protein MotA [Clostridium thailandense]MBV7275134.1 flagellar motor stator protein MotA [Clostridium thailandense]MCH5137371.1 flagellar motor stator protein MotA [Clostridiaceae bacterium UIB06]